MPQEFHVLRCFSCKLFQVHIVRKDKKWQCKICNEKQSVIKVYFNGPAKDCRVFVQETNKKQIEEAHRDSSFDACDDSTEVPDNFTCDTNIEKEGTDDQVKEGKWDKYLRDDDDDESIGKKRCSDGSLDHLNNAKRLKNQDVSEFDATNDTEQSQKDEQVERVSIFQNADDDVDEILTI